MRKIIAILGVAAVVGPATLAILAQNEDRAMATKKCVGEKCVITSSNAVTGKKLHKSQQAKKPGDTLKTLDDKSKSVQAMTSMPLNPISCGDGRAIVSKRFKRVRVGDCKGVNYTYFGLSKGATFRITVDRNTGRIIARAPI